MTADVPLTETDRDAELLAYDELAGRIVAGKILTDPWVDGKPRFRAEPVFVTPAEQRALYRAAEDVAAVYNELCLIVGDHPELLDDFFGLTPFQKAMWLASAPLWHGLARADVFRTDDGLAFAELNCDTPTGEAEAVTLNALTVGEHPGATDPNVELEARFVAMVEALAARELEGGVPRAIGLVYPTEMTDDLALVRLYRRWFQARGYDVVLGSPFNVARADAAEGAERGGMRLFETPFSIMLRHYKTDWWGERVPAWSDAAIADVEPLHGPLRATLEGIASGRCSVVNPFGAVLPQNKRSMAFMWEHLHRFSPRATEVIERHIPVTSRLETMHSEQLLAQQREWVLKSAYGAEGDEVVIGRRVTEEVWRASLAQARPGQWIAQRYFEAHTTQAQESGGGANGGKETVNYGVYVVAGEACGLYARVQEGPTDERAVSAPALVREAR